MLCDYTLPYSPFPYPQALLDCSAAPNMSAISATSTKSAASNHQPHSPHSPCPPVHHAHHTHRVQCPSCPLRLLCPPPFLRPPRTCRGVGLRSGGCVDDLRSRGRKTYQTNITEGGGKLKRSIDVSDISRVNVEGGGEVRA